VSTPELLQKILEARYEFDYATGEHKAQAEKALFDLADSAVKGTDFSRYDLLVALHDRYITFKRERRKNEKVAIAQRLR
jgi:hypothetical protein